MTVSVRLCVDCNEQIPDVRYKRCHGCRAARRGNSCKQCGELLEDIRYRNCYRCRLRDVVDVCVKCGKQIVYVATNRMDRYCDDCRGLIPAEVMAEWIASGRPCETCGVIPSGVNKRLCWRCQNEERGIQCSWRDCERHSQAKGLCPTHYVRAYRKKNGLKLSSRQLIDPVRRRALYERDKWMCGLCNEPVDGSLHWNDDWAPSLDHIVPSSLGGSDDESNLRLAHRICNGRRGARVDV